MFWIYSSGIASGKCHSAVQSLQGKLAVKDARKLPSPAEHRGLQRKTWLRKGCAKTTGKGTLLSKNGV